MNNLIAVETFSHKSTSTILGALDIESISCGGPEFKYEGHDFFISTGKDHKMYTLCKMGSYNNTQGEEVEGLVYLQNLSTDYDKAVERAFELTGMECDYRSLNADLNEIKRGEGSGSEKQEPQGYRGIVGLSACGEKYEEELKQLGFIADGKYPYGRNAGQDIDSLDLELLFYKSNNAKDSKVDQALKDYIDQNIAHKFPAMPSVDEWVDAKPKTDRKGNVKLKKNGDPQLHPMTVSGVVTKVSWSEFEVGYGRMATTYYYSVTGDDGRGYTLKTSVGIDAEFGDRVKVKGSFKDHDIYMGRKRTVLNRIKEI